MDVIKALKENEKPFGLMSEEMQAKAKFIGTHHFSCWNKNWFTVRDQGFSVYMAYKLDPDYRHDYEEKPEIVECEVIQQRFETEPIKFRGPSGPTRLSKAADNPDFIGFKYEDGTIDTHIRVYKGEDGVNWTSCKNMELLLKCKVLTPTKVLVRRS